ncbi:MAG TPA: selenocysteine-specific translation elongation factor [Armatimonadota bacterium]|jgi:selenocysteine-specific elongation factor
MYVITTAGHVDHGKSTLVRALTGINPDRLREEQEREMTIDLGFAWMTLPDGESVGIVDVPGHIDFIENMLAGVGGIDLALLVIAADEGPMPQTREHLAILKLLHVPRIIVALTKIDMSPDPDWTELVCADIRRLLDAPIVPVSARNGVGLSQLVATLQDTLVAARQTSNGRRVNARPRLPVDRVFSMPGFGTVVTGTLIDGSFSVGDDVELMPDGVPARIRGLQTHRQKLDRAAPGSRVAINLNGVTVDQAPRGSVITLPGWIYPTHLLDVQLEVLAPPYQRSALKHNTEVKLFVGTSERVGRVRLLDGNALAPGETGWAQLELAAPVAVVNGDRFVLRLPSPSVTVGGGVIVDVHPRHVYRRHAGAVEASVRERLEAMLQGTPAQRLEKALQQSSFSSPADVMKLAALSGVEMAAAQVELGATGSILQVDDVLAAMTLWHSTLANAVEYISRYHQAQPLALGVPRESLRNQLGLTPKVFHALLQYGVRQEALFDEGEVVRLPGHVVRFNPVQQQAVDALLAEFRAKPYNTPSVKDSSAAVGADVYEVLLQQGLLVQVKLDVVFLRATYEEAVARVRQIVERDGSVTAGQVRDALGTSRKYALGLLEYLDDIGVTKRVGDARVLR